MISSSELKKLTDNFDPDRSLLAVIHKTTKQSLFSEYNFEFSVVCEHTKKTIPSVGHLIKNIPLEVLSQELLLYRSNLLYFNRNSAINLLCSRHLFRINCEVIINLLLTINNVTVGILSFQYERENNCEISSFTECLKRQKEFNDIGKQVITQLIHTEIKHERS